MADRIRRPAQFEDFLSNLKKNDFFDSFKDVLVFAACLGFSREKRVSFSRSSEPIHMTTFSGEFDLMVMDMLSIKETGEPKMMADSNADERIKIFEEYACGGLEIMKHELGQSGQFEEDLISMIFNEENSILEEISDLSGV